jgi:hypothetical protein
MSYGKHAAPAGQRFERAGATVAPSGSMASMLFLWLLPTVALLLALLRS